MLVHWNCSSVPTMTLLLQTKKPYQGRPVCSLPSTAQCRGCRGGVPLITAELANFAFPVEQVGAVTACLAKLIFLFLSASRTYLPSSLMDRGSLGRFFFSLPCISVKESSIMFSSTLLNCISPLRKEPVIRWRVGCEICQNARRCMKPWPIPVQCWNDT